MKVVILDRDGVINEDSKDFVKSVSSRRLSISLCSTWDQWT